MKSIYLLLFSMMLLSCGKSEKQTETESKISNNTVTVTKAQFDTEDMKLGVLNEQEFSKIVKASGFIDVPPQNKASVSTFIGGYVKNTPLLIGDKVRKGQLLVTLESTEFVEIQQQYLEISEQLNYLKSEFERQETLFNEKITSQKNFLKAKSTYKSTLALYNGLRKKLRMMNINPAYVEKGNIASTVNLYAPIQGYITKVNVSNGAYVSPADEILEIVNTEHIHLELSVFEKNILNIKKDQHINFKIPEASDSIFKASVYLVGTSINDANRTIKIHGHIEDDEHTNFVMGMFVESDIITASNIGLALPKEAVFEVEGNYFTLVLFSEEDDVYAFNKVKVTLGKQSEEYTEVLNVNDFKDKKILTKGVFMLVTE